MGKRPRQPKKSATETSEPFDPGSDYTAWTNDRPEWYGKQPAARVGGLGGYPTEGAVGENAIGEFGEFWPPAAGTAPQEYPPREMQADQTLPPFAQDARGEVTGVGSIGPNSPTIVRDGMIRRATILQRLSDTDAVLPKVDSMIDALSAEIDRLRAPSGNLDGPASARERFAQSLQSILDGLKEIRTLLRASIAEPSHAKERILKGQAADIADTIYKAFADDWAKNGSDYAGITMNMALVIGSHWVAGLLGVGAFAASKFMRRKKTTKTKTIKSKDPAGK